MVDTKDDTYMNAEEKKKVKLSNILFGIISNDSINLRFADNNDHVIICALYSDMKAFDMSIIPESDDIRQKLLLTQFRARNFSFDTMYGREAQWIVERDGVAVGSLVVGELDGALRLAEIALVPEHRGGGLGTALIRAVQAAAVARHLPIRLQVHPLNPARHLYGRLGFAEVGVGMANLEMEWHPPFSDAH